VLLYRLAPAVAPRGATGVRRVRLVGCALAGAGAPTPCCATSPGRPITPCATSSALCPRT